MRHFLLFCFLFLNLIGALFVSADVRHVGNGGGFAELKAYVLVNKLPVLLNYCLTSENPCQWDKAALIQVSALKKQVDLKSLTLIAPVLENSSYEISANKLFLNSNDLYQNGIPLPLNKILNLMIHTIIRGGLNEEPSADYLVPELESFESNIVSIKIPQKNLTLHFLTSQEINKNFGNMHFLAFESEKESIDFTSDLIGKMNCAEPHWNILNWNSDLDLLMIHLELNWKCHEDKYSADLQIRFLDDNPFYKIQLLRKIKIN